MNRAHLHLVPTESSARNGNAGKSTPPARSEVIREDRTDSRLASDLLFDVVATVIVSAGTAYFAAHITVALGLVGWALPVELL